MNKRKNKRVKDEKKAAEKERLLPRNRQVQNYYIKKPKKNGIKGVVWDGVRNYQAANNLKKMKKGDLCFFYHSNIGKEIVGIVEVIKSAFTDPTDEKKKICCCQSQI